MLLNIILPLPITTTTGMLMILIFCSGLYTSYQYLCTMPGWLFSDTMCCIWRITFGLNAGCGEFDTCEVQDDFNTCKHWPLLDKGMTTLACMKMCEMPSGIYELAMTAVVIMNMQGRVFNTYCWMENNARIWAKCVTVQTSSVHTTKFSHQKLQANLLLLHLHS